MEEIYGPEDIEKLLLSKDFSELYPEERLYVLRHIAGEDEYNSMRMMLLDISSNDEAISPPIGLKEAMIALHESSHKQGSFKIWLNSLFAALKPKVEWSRPAFQLAGVAGAIVVVVLVYRTLTPDLSTGELALEPRLNQESNQTQPLDEEFIPSIQQYDTIIVEKNLTDRQVLDVSDTSSDFTLGSTKDSDELMADFALDQAPQETNQSTVIEIVEDELEINEEEVLAETEVLPQEAARQSELSNAVDGYSDFEDKASLDLEQADVLASAPSATRAIEPLREEVLSTAATIPSDLLSKLYTAW